MPRTRLSSVFALMFLLGAAVPAVAQDNTAVPQFVAPSISVSSSQLTPTPEMWLYEQQLREYLDPAMAVRRKAEQRSAQRRHRIAAMKWFGMSNERPVVSPDPFNGEYSPSWVGNHSLYPYRWSGESRPWVALRADDRAY